MYIAATQAVQLDMLGTITGVSEAKVNNINIRGRFPL